MKRRFGDVIDQHHGISLLTQCKQRRHEAVVTYGDRYTQIAEESQITDKDILVHCFADGQKEKKIGEKIIRGKYNILKQAIILSVEKRDLFEKIKSLLFGEQIWQRSGEIR